MSNASDTAPRVQPRTVDATTLLAQAGATDAVIVYPAHPAGYAPLARRLADAIQRHSGARPATVTDAELMPARHAPLPDRYRQCPLLLLGNINTNQALVPLYARFYCATDATYPGGDGYDLRTLYNPYGTGANFILAGGSSEQGVARAVDRLIEQLAAAADGTTLRLPFLLEVEPSPGVAQQLAAWPETPLHAKTAEPTSVQAAPELAGRTSRMGLALPTTATGLLRCIGSYAILYAWTGDRRYGQYAADCLLALNGLMADSYGDWHYLIERVVRAMPWLSAGGFLSDADVVRTDELLLGTALGTQDNWWRMRHGRPPLGHRHHGKGTYFFYLKARYLLEQARLNDAGRWLCQRWLDECRAFLDALAQAGADDQEDESTLNNLATVYWYALGEERLDFFESGEARRVALRALALHDNMGAGAGQGGYGEGLAGSMYLQQAASLIVAASAFYYRDGRLKWVMQRLPHLADPLRPDMFALSPAFMHKFDSGPELAPTPPDGLTGVQVMPTAPHHHTIATEPPEHIEPLGHSVDAPETWLHAQGVGRNTLPIARGFNKIVFRQGFQPHAPYLLLQGFQGGYRWQGHMQAANCIVRFGQAGHIFLIQNNDRRPSPYDKNGVYVSDGYNDTPLSPIAEWRAVDDFPTVGLSVTHLAECHRAAWTRHIFWSKPGDGLFVVLDSVQPQADGPYTVHCTWRTPAYATLAGRRWQSAQGQHVFTLQCSETLDATNEEEGAHGGANPYVLRQTRAGQFRQGDPLTFQNLFYVRPQAATENLDLRRLDAARALVLRDGTPLAWCGVAPAGAPLDGPGLAAQALAAWVTPASITLAAMTQLTASGGAWHFASAHPLGLHLDLAAGRAAAQIDGPGIPSATLQVTLDGAAQTYTLTAGAPVTFPLPAQGCRLLAALLAQQLAALAAASPPQPTASPTPPPAPQGRWQPGGTFDGWTRVPERMRQLTVSADPPPLDGFAEQLTDTVLPEWRDIWQQWPSARDVSVTLTLDERRPIERLRLIGDSQRMPTLRVFRPLPAGITIALSDDGFQNDVRPVTVPDARGVLHFRRYHTFIDPMETVEIPVGQAARQVRCHVPRPTDGGPLVWHEIEVYGSQQVAPPLRHLAAADLDNDGHTEAVLINAAHELVVLADDGTVRWRQTLPDATTHLSCHDLDGKGDQTLCIGVLGGELRLLSHDGQLRQALPLAKWSREAGHIAFGFFNAVEGVNVWHRQPDGRAALVVGGYGLSLFLGLEGELLGHAWADGAWQVDPLPVPTAAPRVWDVWVRNIWNHGICVYEGQAGLQHSGVAIFFGGVQQAMFRPLRKVIPFVTGYAVAFERIAPGADPGDGVVTPADKVLAVTEGGVGVLSVTARDWLWKIEGGTPITAGLYADRGGETEVITGGREGFVAAFAAADGRPLRRVIAGAPVVGLAALPAAGVLAVATRRGVLAFDVDWHIIGQWPVAAQRVCRLGQRSLLVVRHDGAAQVLTWAG